MSIMIKGRAVEIVQLDDDETYARRLNYQLMTGGWRHMPPNLRMSIVKTGLHKYYEYELKFTKLCCLRFCGKISSATFCRSLRNKHFIIQDAEKNYQNTIKRPLCILACTEMGILPKDMFAKYFEGQDMDLAHALYLFENWMKNGGLEGYYAELSQFRSLQIIESFDS